MFPTKKLTKNFQIWLKNKGIDISKGEFQAHAINYDYQGFKFGNIFLAGDAAGLASGWTGEGIYQALISGEEVAKTILNKNHKPNKINELLKTKNLHNKILDVIINLGFLRQLFFESVGVLLKSKSFSKKVIDIIA